MQCNIMKKEEYTAPKGELIRLGRMLNLMNQSFSMEASFDDWSGGDLLDNDLDDSSEGSDFTNGGLLGNN